MTSEVFGIGGCKEVKSSIFCAQQCSKREHQMKGCVAEHCFLSAQTPDHMRPLLHVLQSRQTGGLCGHQSHCLVSTCL